MNGFVWMHADMKFIKPGSLDDDLMAKNNTDDVAHCGKILQTLNEYSGDQLYRYYRYMCYLVTRNLVLDNHTVELGIESIYLFARLLE
jgi:hypothetical protein